MDQGKLNLVISSLGVERIKLGEVLIFVTTLKSNGTAEVFYIATSQNELIDALNTAYELKIKFMVLGSGSKIRITSKGVKGLVIKNRTSGVKINGVKGKVGREGIGIEEAMVEVDSGVSIGKLNEFLAEQNLASVISNGSSTASMGGSFFSDPNIQNLTHKIKVWQKGDVDDKDVIELSRNEDIILSMILKIKAKG